MVRLSFVGDVMCEYTRLKTFLNKAGEYDFSPLFSGVKTEFMNSDLVVANLETPLAGETLKYSWKDYQFNTPEQLGIAMKNAGIRVVSTANNHVLDRGFEGLEKTLENLDAIGLKHTGTARTKEEAKPLILEVKGIKIGLLSYTYGTEACYNGFYLQQGEEYKVNLLRDQELKNPVRRYFYVSKDFFPRACRAAYRRLLPNLAKRPVGELKEKDKIQRAHLLNDISYAKGNSDLVIMCLHCGGQFNDSPTEYTKEISKFCMDNGVDVVIGNHEHLIQGIQLDDKKHIISYCLGNFTSNYGIERKPFDKNAECSVLLNFYLDENTKEIVKIGFQILISEKNEADVIGTKLLYDCVKSSDESLKLELCEKNRRAVNAFLGTNEQSIELQKEYFIS